MDFVARPPRHPSLQGVVRSLWEARAPGAAGYETRLPSGTTQLLINLAADHLHAFELPALHERRRLPAALVHGSHARPCGLDRMDQRAVIGIVFEPGTARVVLGIAQDARSGRSPPRSGSRREGSVDGSAPSSAYVPSRWFV